MIRIEPKNVTFKTKIDRAIRAKKESLKVVASRTAQRCYAVENRTKGTTYTVNFFIRNGAKFAGCTCKAGAVSQSKRPAGNLWRAVFLLGASVFSLYVSVMMSKRELIQNE